jgi:hypothetical protein
MTAPHDSDSKSPDFGVAKVRLRYLDWYLVSEFRSGIEVKVALEAVLANLPQTPHSAGALSTGYVLFNVINILSLWIFQFCGYTIWKFTINLICHLI